MFLVIEIQKSESGLAALCTQHDTLREAQSKYHQVLAYAAVSGLPRHSAAILNEAGANICNESYGDDE